MDKIAIITGGATGIGYAIAKRFVCSNINTILVGRDKNKLEAASAEMGELTDWFICDLSDLKSIPALVRAVIDKYGKIDILVNNAGIHSKKKMLAVSDEEYQNVILTNQTSVFSLSRAVAGYMIRSGSGVILNISSMASHYGLPDVIAYAASKAAVEGMTRAMAAELSPSGIRVKKDTRPFYKAHLSNF